MSDIVPSTLTLLGQGVQASLSQMVQASLIGGSEVTVDKLLLDTPVQGEDNTMSMRVSIRPDVYNLPHWNHYGDVIYTYHRLDFAELFSGMTLNVKLPRHSTSQVLANIFNTVLGLSLEPLLDYVVEDIDFVSHGEYTFRAPADSARFYGQVQVMVYTTYAGGQ